MKIVLLQTQHVSLGSTSNNSTNVANSSREYLRYVPITLSPVISYERHPLQNCYSLCRNPTESNMGIASKFWDMQMEVGLKEQRSSYSGHYDGILKAHDFGPGGVLETLNKHCDGHLKLNVDFVNISRGLYGEQVNINSGEQALAKNGTLEKFGFVKDSIPIQTNYQFHHEWMSSSTAFAGKVTITAIIPDSVFALDDSSVEDKLFVNKKLLKDEIACDATVIEQNGVGVKCHKSFLSAHSTVFASMFGGSMKESKTGTLEMADMTEASVRAFLAYLYYWETKEAKNNSLICFKLFHAGHKYAIAPLEECMKTILLAKDNGWYDVDVDMRLFLFSRHLGNGNALKIKAIQVLKSKFSVLEKSKSYKQLFKKDPDAAMELCKYAFAV